MELCHGRDNEWVTTMTVSHESYGEVVIVDFTVSEVTAGAWKSPTGPQAPSVIIVARPWYSLIYCSGSTIVPSFRLIVIPAIAQLSSVCGGSAVIPFPQQFYIFTTIKTLLQETLDPSVIVVARPLFGIAFRPIGVPRGHIAREGFIE